MERLRLGISAEAIIDVESKLLASINTEDLDDIAIFTRGVVIRMRTEQPPLFGFFQSRLRSQFQVASSLTLGYAAALTYEMIPARIKKEPLFQRDVDVAVQSLLERSQGEDNVGVDSTWFHRKLEIDSPDYYGWVGTMVADLDDLGAKKDFYLGAMIVALVFYMREDAKGLAAEFLGEEATT
ncbi:MAG: hypothetical protein HYW33_00785 [Candidatus Blackburnbacteria bacterium]|nr:hypothetical protein [Candidatus Blackburnbacteria bacterium]